MTVPARPAVPHDELLAQLGWVQALARTLVRDPQTALDVAQETMVVALERPPRALGGRGLRAWLAAVTRTQARQSARGARRRTAREHRAAVSERSGADPSDVVARADLQRAVVERVMALSEPHRSTILLRYLDGLSTAEIAQREGISPEAVRKRLQRGLDALRRTLDAEHGGDRRSWIAVLAPLAFPPRSEAPLASLLRAGFAGALGAGLAITVWVVLVWSDERTDGHVPAESPATAQVIVPPPVAGVSFASDVRGAARPLVPASRGGGVTIDDPRIVTAELRRLVRGRVVDADARPVAGVRMGFEPGFDGASANPGDATATAISGAGGRFTLEPPMVPGRLLAASSAWVTLFGGNATEAMGADEQLVIVAPCAPLAGRLLDGAGRPVDGGTVAVTLPPGLRARFEGPTDTRSPFRIEVPTGADGRFDLPRAPRVPGALLVARAPGFAVATWPAPDISDLGLVLTLHRPPATLEGRVVDGRGAPVAGAWVSRGDEVVVSDDEGRFRFVRPWPGPAAGPRTDAGAGPVARARLVAVKAGHQAAVILAEVPPDGGDPAWPADVELRLGPPARELRGLVVDRNGEPRPGMRVWVADPTVLARPPGEAGRSNVETTDWWTGERHGPVVMESVAAGTPDRTWAVADTDGQGRFVIAGLMDRDYTVTAMNPWTLEHVASPPVPAGAAGVRLVLAVESHPRLTGRVLTRHGVPLAGVVVEPRWDALRIEDTNFIATAPAAWTLTDEHGRFVLEGVPVADVHLHLHDRRVLPVDWGRDGLSVLADERGADIVVALRVDVRVAMADPAEADRARFLDGEGRPLGVTRMLFGRRETWDAAELVAGRSEVFAVSDAAATVVFEKDGTEVRREALRWVTGTVNVLR